jgi:hypothetical protein
MKLALSLSLSLSLRSLCSQETGLLSNVEPWFRIQSFERRISEWLLSSSCSSGRRSLNHLQGTRLEGLLGDSRLLFLFCTI